MAKNRRPLIKRSLLSSAIALAAAGIAQDVYAVDLCTTATTPVSTAAAADNCDITDAGGSLTVTGGGTIGAGVTVNADTVTISNAGTISGTTTALRYNNDLATTLTNSGTVSVESTAPFTTAWGVYVDADITGTVNNSNTISASSTADATANYQGPASAYGFYAAGMSGTGALTNTGTISATASSANPSSVLYWNWANALYIDGMADSSVITNNGTISAEATAEQGWGEAYAVLLGAMSGDAEFRNNNRITATMNASGADSSLWRGGSAYGIYVNSGMSGNAAIVNAGTIDIKANGSSWVSGYGIYTSSLADAAQVSNTGTIRVTGTSHSEMNSSTGSAGSVYGIYTSGSLSGTASVSNAGLIDVMMDGSSWGYAYGMYFSGGASGTAAITNSGTIKATTISTNEYQTSTVSGGSAYGIYFSGTMNGDSTLTNSGTINASVTGNTWVYGYGIYASTLSGNAQVSNTNTGSITVRGYSHNTATSEGSGGSVYGILVSNTGGAASISNSGRIDLAIDGSSWVYGYGIATWNMSGTGNSISNSGTIKVSAVSNATQQTGDVSGGSVYGIYAYSNSATDASVVNSGVIDVSITGKTWVSGYGIYAGGSYYGASEIANSGTIKVRAYSRNDLTTSYSGGSVYGIDAGNLYGSSSVSNSGLIDLGVLGSTWVSGYGISTNMYGTGNSVSNSGTIRVSAVSDAAQTSEVSGGSVYGIYAYSNSATDASVVNSGIIDLSITGKTWVSGYGIYASGTLNGASEVTNSGSITVRAVTHNDMTSNGSGGSVYGIYAGTLSGTTAVTNSGTINLYVEGSSWVSGTGIRTSTMGAGTSVTNSGTINIVALSKPIYGNSESGGSAYGIRTGSLAAGASVTNSGTINASVTGETWVSIDGIRTGTLTDATVTNSGVINMVARSHDVHGNEPSGGSVHGIYVSGSMNGTSSITNSGRIVGSVEGGSWVSAYGIYNGWNSMYGTSSMSNTGTIIVSASNQDGSVSGGSVYGIMGGYLNDAASLSNSGLIVANISVETSASAYGLYAEALNGTSSITNSGTIRLNATSLNDDTVSAAGIYAGSSSGTATITNSGTIEITANGRDEGDVFGIYNNGSAAIVNTGSMNAGIYTWGNVDNSGAVTARAGSGSFINGNLTQGAGAVWTMQMGNPFDYGSLYVGGDADFTAANDFVIAVAGDAQLHDGDTFEDVVYVSGTLTAPAGFDVTDNSLFWNFAVTEDADGFDLTADYLGAASVLADYGVDGSFAAFLDGVIAQGQSSPYAELASALNGATVGSNLSGVLASVSPALLGAAAQATQLVGRGAGAVVDVRQGEAGESSGDGLKNYGWWLKPYFGSASQDDDGNISGYDVDSNGFVIGFDAEASDTTRVGVAVASTSAEADGSGAQLDIAATQLIVYGAYALDDRTDLNMRLGYGMNAYDSVRSVALTGDVAAADYDGTQLSLAADWTRAIKTSEKNTFVPSIGLQYALVEIDGYTERGALGYSQQTRDADDDVMLISANAGYERDLGKNRAFLANLGLAFDTSSDAASVTTSMAGGGGTYTVNGIEQDATIVMAGVGYRHITARGTEISANYDLESRSDFMANTVSVKFKMPF